MSQTVTVGADVTFSVAAVENPAIQFVVPEPIKFQWFFNGWPIEGATGATLALEDVALRHAGTYSALVRWGPGWVRSLPATLSVASPALAGVIGPGSQLADNGTDVTFAVTTDGAASLDGLSFRWRYNGRNIPGPASATHTILNAGTTAAGTYFVDVSNESELLARYVATLRIHTEARLVNLSARGVVGTAADRMIVGLVIRGNGTKEVLVRGIGPTLTTRFGVPNTLAEPFLRLNDRRGELVDENGKWAPELEPVFVAAGAFLLTPDSEDAALVQTLEPGLYTGWVTGENDAAGVALAEVYDADEGTPTAELVNLSARAWVGENEKVLTAGFTIEGTTSITVLIRGIGPTLLNRFALRSAIARTRITLHAGDHVLDENSDWADDADIEETATHVGAFALGRGSRDSAMIVTLPPGGYTAQVSGVNRTTGVALVEVYEVR